MKRTTRVRWCPGGESNPHEEKSPEDFKSSASAIPPPGPWHYKLIGSKQLKQHRYERLDARTERSTDTTLTPGVVEHSHADDGSQRMLWGEMGTAHRHCAGLVV